MKYNVKKRDLRTMNVVAAVTEKEHEEIYRCALEENVSVSYYIREAIKFYMDSKNKQ